MSGGIYDGYEYAKGRSLTGDNRRIGEQPMSESLEQRILEAKDGWEFVLRNHTRRVRALLEEKNGRLAALKARAEAAEARLAILDVQDVELPQWTGSDELKVEAERWWNAVKDYKGGVHAAKTWYQCALSRERQLLDAQRAAQAWKEVARDLRKQVHPVGSESVQKACAAYDALAGKEQ